MLSGTRRETRVVIAVKKASENFWAEVNLKMMEWACAYKLRGTAMQHSVTNNDPQVTFIPQVS